MAALFVYELSLYIIMYLSNPVSYCWSGNGIVIDVLLCIVSVFFELVGLILSQLWTHVDAFSMRSICGPSAKVSLTAIKYFNSSAYQIHLGTYPVHFWCQSNLFWARYPHACGGIELVYVASSISTTNIVIIMCVIGAGSAYLVAHWVRVWRELNLFWASYCHMRSTSKLHYKSSNISVTTLSTIIQTTLALSACKGAGLCPVWHRSDRF